MSIRTKRAAGLVAALATTAALTGAGPASAAVTKTAITSPVAGFTYYDGNVADSNILTVSGTSDGTTGDQVTLLCSYGDGNYNYFGVFDVNADGSFTAEVQQPSQQTCTLRALAGDNSDSDDFAAYPGPTIGFGSTDTLVDDTNPDGPTAYDYNVYSSTLKTRNHFESLGSCGIEFTELYDTGLGEHNGTWDCVADLDYADSGLQGSDLRVDGHPALLPAGAVSNNNASEGIPALDVDKSFDAKTGLWTIVETNPAVFCATVDETIDDYVDAPADACDHYIPAGISIQRTTTESRDGRVVSFDDGYSSTDGAQHAVTAYYENVLQGDTAQFPGEPDLEQHGPGTIVDLSGSSSGTIYTQEDRRYLPGTKNTQGALTYTSAPTRAIFSDEGEFALQYDRTVPATGTVTIPQTYSVAFTRDQIVTQSNQLSDASSAPVVAFTSPAAGTVVDSDAVSVSGTASDNVGVSSLKVDGLPTTVNANGTWSQRVSLKPGANTVTAVATDDAGNVSQAQLSVVSSPKTGSAAVASASSCVVPDVKGLTRDAASAKLVDAGCTVGTVVAIASKTVAKGNVISQGNAAQTKVPVFYPVSLKLSSGKPGSARVVKRTASLAGRNVKIAVSCAASAGSRCKAQIILRTAGRKRLGAKVVTVAQGKKQTVRIRLSRRDAKALRAAGTQKAVVKVAARKGGTSSSKKVTLKG